MEIKHGDYVWVQVTRDKERLGKVKWIKDLMTGTFYFIEFDNEVNSGAYYESHSVRLARKKNDPPGELFLTPEKSDLKSVSAIKGGTKHDTGKPDLSLIPYSAEQGIAKAFMDGEKKYGRYNYLKGMKWSRLIGAAKRHLGAFTNGEDCAQDSKLNHLYHAAANICMLIEYYEKNIGEDDRNKGVKND